MTRCGKRVGSTLSLWLLFASLAQSTELLTNGGFETGTLTGWNQASLGDGSFLAGNSLLTPLSGSSTVGPAEGNWYAVTDLLGPGTHALFTIFTIPMPSLSVVLSFRMFVNSLVPAVVNPLGLDHTEGPNQHARVDLLALGSGQFSTGASVIRNFYLGVDPGPNPHSYTSYSFDITPQVGQGGSFLLRFADTANLDFLHLGVDGVSVDSGPMQVVPEPSSFGLTLVGCGVLLRIGLRRRKPA